MLSKSSRRGAREHLSRVALLRLQSGVAQMFILCQQLFKRNRGWLLKEPLVLIKSESPLTWSWCAWCNNVCVCERESALFQAHETKQRKSSLDETVGFVHFLLGAGALGNGVLGQLTAVWSALEVMMERLV